MLDSDSESESIPEMIPLLLESESEYVGTVSKTTVSETLMIALF